MHFNHLHFFVDNLSAWYDRFIEEWGATPSSGPKATLSLDQGAATTVLRLGHVPIMLSAPVRRGDPADQYLRHHPPGIGDVGFRVDCLHETLARLVDRGGTILTPVQNSPVDSLKWCRVQGWGNITHTLLETPLAGTWLPGWGNITHNQAVGVNSLIETIDHAVINVAPGQLQEAVAWYVNQLGFCPRQQFTIDTPNSGLQSQVLSHPHGDAQLPINEPATPNSQVQEFLTWNQGSGIQHVALRTSNILAAVHTLKKRGIRFLSVPPSYYQALADRPGYSLEASTLEAIARLEVLIDWDPHRPQACLLQTFTQPLLDIPTLFFEIIQRRSLGQHGIGSAVARELA